MKKTILFLTTLLALTCLFAIGISAETVLNTHDTDAFGELSVFDESITIGRTDNANGFNPYQADGVSYARVVIGDGTTFYTFPSYYIFVKNAYESGSPLFQYDFSAINSAMETATGINPGWTKTSVYRLELPECMNRLNGGNQAFDGFNNMIELYMPANTTTVGENKTCLFRDCFNVEVIHNIDTFLFKKGCLTDAFKNCRKLTSLTLCYSPDVVATGANAFYDCRSLVSVNFSDAFPNVTDIGNRCFYNCLALTSLSAAGQDGAVIFNEGVTKIGEYAFQNDSAFKYLSIPATVTYIGPAAFHTCKSLEFVDFNNNQNDIDFNNWGHFMNCSSLKAVSMPDNVDMVMNRIFSGCKNLQALYLPRATVNIESNGYGEGSSFSYCNNVYFVNEPFSVRDENGIFYGDSFAMPAKPAIYYMPSGLKSIFQRDSGVGFAQCYNLNSVIVFPKTLTQFWINDGVFYECGIKGNKTTVVFLGDMTNLRIGMRESRARGISYIFANPNDVDLSSVNVIDTSPSYTPYFNGDESVYFCASNKYFKLYNLGGGSDDAQYTNDNTPLLDKSCYLAEPNRTTTTKPGCVINSFTNTYCFCGKLTAETENLHTATGHDFVNGEKGYQFNSLFAQALSYDICANGCGETDHYVSAGYVITDVGFSACTYNNKVAFARVFVVNNELLDIYEMQKGVSVEFGFAIGTIAGVNQEDGLTLDEFAKTIVTKKSGEPASRKNYNFIMTYKNDTYKDAFIYVTAYVKEGDNVVFADETLQQVSYNSIANS